MTKEFLSPSPESTQKLAARIGAAVEAGDVIALSGDLGSGKTCFTQGLAAGLGIPDGRGVNSPTFVLLNVYQGRLPIYHFDTYRLGDPDTWLDLGAEDMLYGDGVCVIEWADLVESVLPEDRLNIEFSHVSYEERLLKFVALGARAESMLARVFEKSE